MITTTDILANGLSEYRNVGGKLGRMVRGGELVPLARGLYETSTNVPGECLAGSICGPSYLSYEYALSRRGLIPEAAFAFTSATVGKRKTKQFTNRFGVYTYRDVPMAVFPLGVKLETRGEYYYWMAGPEKALCDQLHTLPPARSCDDLARMLFDDMRIDPHILFALSENLLDQIASAYRSTNARLLATLVKKGLQ